MQKNYTIHLFSLDGEHKRWKEFDTKDEAMQALWDIGSTWIFYPLQFIGTEKSVYCERTEGHNGSKTFYRPVKSVMNTIKSLFMPGEEISEMDMQYAYNIINS